MKCFLSILALLVLALPSVGQVVSGGGKGGAPTTDFTKTLLLADDAAEARATLGVGTNGTGVAAAELAAQGSAITNNLNSKADSTNGTLIGPTITIEPSLRWSHTASSTYYPIDGSHGQAQGVATDGTNLYTFYNEVVLKTLKTNGLYSPVLTNTTPHPDDSAFYNHIIDGEYYNGKIYGGDSYWTGVAATSSNSVLVIRDATTLEVDSYVSVTNKMNIMTATTIAPSLNRIFCAYFDSDNLSPTLHAYTLDTMLYVEEITLVDNSGVARPLYFPQDLEYRDGYIYAVCDSVNGAGMVFAITTNGVVSDQPQMFNTLTGTESEGIDISGDEMLYYPAGSTNVYVFDQLANYGLTDDTGLLADHVFTPNNPSLKLPTSISSGLARNPMDDGLILHYSFSEANFSPYTVDWSPYANHGFLHTSKSNMFTGGLFGRGYQGATNRYITVKGGDAVSGLTNLSVSAWVKFPATVPSRQRIVSKALSTDVIEWYLDILTDTSLAAVVKNSSGTSTTVIGDVSSIGDGDWHSIVLTYDQTNSSLYLDGAFVTNGALTGNIYSEPYVPIQVGGYNVFNQWNFTGTMDELRIWERALSTNEIALLYREGVPSSGGSADLTAVEGRLDDLEEAVDTGATGPGQITLPDDDDTHTVKVSAAETIVTNLNIILPDRPSTGLYYGTVSDVTNVTLTAITNGANAQVLTIASGVPTWAAATGGGTGLTNPLAEDIDANQKSGTNWMYLDLRDASDNVTALLSLKQSTNGLLELRKGWATGITNRMSIGYDGGLASYFIGNEEDSGGSVTPGVSPIQFSFSSYLFTVGGVDMMNFSSSGIMFSSDGVYDIGAIDGFRPDEVHAASKMTVGGNEVLTTASTNLPNSTATNILSSITSVDIAKEYSDYEITESITVTGLSNVTNTLAQSAVLYLTNSAATNVVLTLPSAWNTTDGERTYTITNGTLSVLSVNSYGNKWTNAVCAPLF